MKIPPIIWDIYLEVDESYVRHKLLNPTLKELAKEVQVEALD